MDDTDNGNGRQDEAKQPDPDRGVASEMLDTDEMELRERLTVLEEQLAVTRQAMSLLAVAIMVGCLIAAAYAIRSAGTRA